MNQKQSKDIEEDSVLRECFDLVVEPEPSPEFVSTVMARIDARGAVEYRESVAFQWSNFVEHFFDSTGWLPAGIVAGLVGVILSLSSSGGAVFVSTEELILSEVKDAALFATLSGLESYDSILLERESL